MCNGHESVQAREVEIKQIAVWSNLMDVLSSCQNHEYPRVPLDHLGLRPTGCIYYPLSLFRRSQNKPTSAQPGIQTAMISHNIWLQTDVFNFIKALNSIFHRTPAKRPALKFILLLYIFKKIITVSSNNISNSNNNNHRKSRKYCCL